MIKEPTDFVGNILAKLVAKALAKPSMVSKVEGWKMIVTLSSDYYPVSMVFDEGVTVIRKIDADATLNVEMNFAVIIDLVEGNTSMVRAMLERKIRVRGLFRHPIATFRFYRLMQTIIGE
ncbi:MAG: hypothetical protein P1Q69_06105 [Candidatus Thorarchaeota archaeon]|nr:hypothetical protein [Candidatus Thorarchaeota archaeon]